jgi:hypothetical protein
MTIKEAVSVVKEFMGSYTGTHGCAMRTIVADVERRCCTVRSKWSAKQTKYARCKQK